MTNMKNGMEVVLKADARGRLRMPAEKREKLLDEFERSGLSGTKFAALSGVNYQTFASWVIRRKRERQGMKTPASGPDQVRWLEAMVQEAAGSVPVKVHLPGGAWMEIAQSDQVPLASALVRALQQPAVSC
jgi:hypothetical protein